MTMMICTIFALSNFRIKRKEQKERMKQKEREEYEMNQPVGDTLLPGEHDLIMFVLYSLEGWSFFRRLGAIFPQKVSSQE